MEKNKKITIIISAIIFFIITIASIVKVYNKHIDNLYSVVEKKICENTKDCYSDGICKDDVITLGFLIKNGYLSTQINPITKEDISEDLEIKWNKEECILNIR